MPTPVLPASSDHPSITYHTVTLGPLTREGHALAEITEQDEAGQQHTRTLSVPAGLPGEIVTIAIEDVGARFIAPRPRPAIAVAGNPVHLA